MQVGRFKLKSLARLATGPDSFISSAPLIGVIDHITGTHLIVDTGSQVSVWPNSLLPNNSTLIPLAEPITLQTVGGTKIHPLGCAKIKLQLSQDKNVFHEWSFIVADIATAILGVDFCTFNELSVDLPKMILGDCIPLISKPATNMCLQLSAADVDKLLAKFQLSTEPVNFKEPVKHNVVHHIETTGPPVTAKPRRLAPDKHRIAQQEFQRLVDLGIARRSKSCWASPLHLVPKKDGGWRICGDYRRLNTVTLPDKYPLPFLHDFSSKLHDCTVFSKLDITRAYNNIPIVESDIPKTAITTPFGLFEFLRLGFGFRNAGQTYQRFMDDLLGDLDYCYTYVDDILVASKTRSEHIQHIETVLERLQHCGIKIHLEKCVIGADRLNFLGHEISADGTSPLPAKVQAIIDFPRPETQAELGRFIGMFTYYHRFIQHASEILRPLHHAHTARGKRSKQLVNWSPELETAFKKAKTALAECAKLQHPNPKLPLSLQVDASGTSIGAVLQHYTDGSWAPLSFFSRTLTSAESRYSVFGRELLAAYNSVSHFRHALEGREFIIYTDHRPLTSALQSSSATRSDREARHLDFISQFTSDIRYVPGSQNSVADALSRTVSMIMAPTPRFDDFTGLAAAQEEDSELQDFIASSHSLQLRRVPVTSDTQIWADFSTGRCRPLLPLALRRPYFKLIHNLSHPGGRSTLNTIQQRFVWPSMRSDVRLWARQCPACQRSKVQRHTKSPLQSFKLPQDRFRHIHIDLVGPLPVSNNCQYVLTVIDRFTRWPEVVPLSRIDAETVADALLYNWVARFGVPESITTDQGRQFESSLWRRLMELTGAKRHRTTSYHPQSNGLVERFHRSLKNSLRASCTGHYWTQKLAVVLLGIRTAYKDDLKCSSAELVYGTTLRLPGEFLEPSVSACTSPVTFCERLKTNMRTLTPRPPRHGKAVFHVPADLLSCSHVFVRAEQLRSSLSALYDGPFKVLTRDTKSVTIENSRGKPVKISIDRCKPSFVQNCDNGSTVANEHHRTSARRRVHFAIDGALEIHAAPNRTPPTVTTVPGSSILRTRSGRVIRQPLRFRQTEGVV